MFQVDLLGGQKTGFYLDQRENRRIVGGLCRRPAGAQRLQLHRRVSPSMRWRGGAAHVTNVDTSYDALDGAEAALRLNGFDPDTQAESIQGDVFQVLRAFRDEGPAVRPGDPRSARSSPRSKAELDGAARGYKDINLLALRLLAPGGLLATFSCSGLVTPDLFQKIVFGASIDAGRDAQIIGPAEPGARPSHPAQLPGGRVSEGVARRVDSRRLPAVAEATAVGDSAAPSCSTASPRPESTEMTGLSAAARVLGA